MRQRRATQLDNGRETDGRIKRGKAGIGRNLLMSQCLHTHDGFNGTARSQRVPEKSFSARNRRQAFAEYLF
jgi:hypothetical protein